MCLSVHQFNQPIIGRSSFNTSRFPRAGPVPGVLLVPFLSLLEQPLSFDGSRIADEHSLSASEREAGGLVDHRFGEFASWCPRSLTATAVFLLERG